MPCSQGHSFSWSYAPLQKQFANLSRIGVAQPFLAVWFLKNSTKAHSQEWLCFLTARNERVAPNLRDRGRPRLRHDGLQFAAQNCDHCFDAFLPKRGERPNV